MCDVGGPGEAVADVVPVSSPGVESVAKAGERRRAAALSEHTDRRVWLLKLHISYLQGRGGQRG